MQRTLQLLSRERRAGDARQLGLWQPLLTEAPLSPGGIGDAIGDHDELLSGPHLDVLDPPGRRRRRRRAPAPRRLPRPPSRRRRAAGGGRPATARRTGCSGSSPIARAATLQRAAPRRASSSRLSVSSAITGSPVRSSRGAEGVAGRAVTEAAGRLTGDVADHHHPAAGDAKGVVEVAADLVLSPSGAVHGGDRPARDIGERRRQQPALQGLGDLGPFPLAALEVGEEAGVVQRQCHPAAEDAGESASPRGGSAGPSD